VRIVRAQRRPSGAAALAAAAILVIAVFYLRIPYFALTPGPVQDVGTLIAVKGAKTTPLKGQLLLTTVSLHEIRIGEAMRGWFDPSIAILSRSAIIPPGSSEDEVEQRTTAQMEESHVFAAAAALKLLGYAVKVEPTGVRVRAIEDGVPASQALRGGDVVVGADGLPVKRPEDLIAAIHRHKVGDSIGLRIMRGTETIEVTTKTIGRSENPVDPMIGISIEPVPRIQLPLAIQIESLGIGGPSAGLMFGLGIYDLLDAGDLTMGRVVAGTGEIEIDGTVGPVGGIRQKIESARRAGAELFIVPTVELEQACAVAKGMPVVGVDRLKQAVDALRSPRSGFAHSCP
jgi:PDZ domain-containing protein